MPNCAYSEASLNMTKTSFHVIALTALAALALTSCASPFTPSSAVPAAQRPPSELPNRVMIPAVGRGAPSGSPPPAASPVATNAPVIAAAAASPAPQKPESASAFRFCAHRTDFKPAAPLCPESALAVAPGVTRINGVWTVAAWPGASLSGRWYVNGKAVTDPAGAKTRALCWDGKPEALGFTRSGPQFVALSATAFGAASLGQGAYRFELYVDGKLILAEGFGIGAFDPALIAAAPTGGVAQACPR
jgi:hypothetical protein